ncbi:MAG: hypothetical protein AAFQ84_08400 [Pseudomonadota bacterium]
MFKQFGNRHGLVAGLGIALAAGIALTAHAQFASVDEITSEVERPRRGGKVYQSATVLRGMAVTDKGLYFLAMVPNLDGIRGECPHQPVRRNTANNRIFNVDQARGADSQISGIDLRADIELHLSLSHPNYDMLSRQIQSYADNGYNKATSIGLTYRPTGIDCQAEIVGIGIGNHTLAP